MNLCSTDVSRIFQLCRVSQTGWTAVGLFFGKIPIRGFFGIIFIYLVGGILLFIEMGWSAGIALLILLSLFPLQGFMGKKIVIKIYFFRKKNISTPSTECFSYRRKSENYE